jgi:hypothetical protein
MDFLRKYWVWLVTMICVILLGVILVPTWSHAQTVTTTDGGVIVPYGNWLADFLNYVQPLLITLMYAVITMVVGMLPVWVQKFVKPTLLTMRTDQLFEKAVASAVAGIRGVTDSQTATIPTTNWVVKEATRIILARGAPAVLDFAEKSVGSFAEKILARLEKHDVIPANYSLQDAMKAVADVAAAPAAISVAGVGSRALSKVELSVTVAKAAPVQSAIQGPSDMAIEPHMVPSASASTSAS